VSIDRRTKLLWLSNARAAAGNMSLPAHVRDKYQSAADHLGLSVDLENALAEKQEREAMSSMQSPPQGASQDTSLSQPPSLGQQESPQESQEQQSSPLLQPVPSQLVEKPPQGA
jgi:hypothetical protein